MNKPTKGIAVDCSCSGNPGIAEYRGIDISTGNVLFEHKIPGLCTNNIAEFAALVHGVLFLIENNIEGQVYSDSQTALAWYKHKKHKSRLAFDSKTEYAHKLLNRSILKTPDTGRMRFVDFWYNKVWGETPADYGRK